MQTLSTNVCYLLFRRGVDQTDPPLLDHVSGPVQAQLHVFAGAALYRVLADMNATDVVSHNADRLGAVIKHGFSDIGVLLNH